MKRNLNLAVGCLSLMALLSACEESETLVTLGFPFDGTCMSLREFATGSKVQSMELLFFGADPQACAGDQIPFSVRGAVESTYKYCSGVHAMGQFSTDPLDSSVGCTPQASTCFPEYQQHALRVDYKNLSCANFKFTIKDPSTGVTVGSVSDECVLTLNTNMKHVAQITAYSLDNQTFSRTYNLKCPR